MTFGKALTTVTSGARRRKPRIEGLNSRIESPEISNGWAQNWAQSKADRGGKLRKVLDFAGATRRIRTDDLLITNQLLYRLS